MLEQQQQVTNPLSHFFSGKIEVSNHKRGRVSSQKFKNLGEGGFKKADVKIKA